MYIVYIYFYIKNFLPGNYYNFRN